MSVTVLCSWCRLGFHGHSDPCKDCAGCMADDQYQLDANERRDRAVHILAMRFASHAVQKAELQAQPELDGIVQAFEPEHLRAIVDRLQWIAQQLEPGDDQFYNALDELMDRPE